MTNPYQNTATARLIADRIRDLAHKKTQAKIAGEAGFPDANMITFLKNGRNKVPWTACRRLQRRWRSIRRISCVLRLSKAVGATAAKAIADISGTPATENERAWLQELRDASDNRDPRITARSRVAHRGIFGK